jgi:anti-sigma regulatory factor (Ser/Thr protein kinase)
MQQKTSNASHALAAGPDAGPARAAPAAAAPGPTAEARDHPGGHASTCLGIDRRDAARARRLTRSALTSWHLDDLADDAETIAAELAANAIAAATPPPGTRPAIIFALHHRPPLLLISVWDNGPGEPRPAAPGPDDIQGRGLAITETLTGGKWGWWPAPHSGGKVVWASLPAPDQTRRAC